MDELSVSAVEADPIVTTTEGEAPEGQAQDQTAAPEGEEKKSAAAARRERDKAYKARLIEEKTAADAARDAALAKLDRLQKERDADKAPKEGDFTDSLEYLAEKAAWSAGQRLTNREATAAEAEAATARARADVISQQEAVLLAQAWEHQATDARTRYADFDAKIGQPDLFPKGSHLIPMIQSSDVAGDLAYRLATDRALHDSLLKMNPVQAAREIGRLEASITAPRARTSTNAPDPINPVKGSNGATRDPAKMAPSEYSAWRAAGGKIG